MIYKTMPILDLVSAVVIFFSPLFPGSIFYYIAGYLLIKGGLFVLLSKDSASVLDVAIGIYVLLIIAGISHFVLNSAASLFLAQKGALGLITI